MKKKFIYIILIFFPLFLQSKARDVNVYLELLGNAPGLKPTIEYNLLTFEFLSEKHITYINFGASMIGAVNSGYFYTSPIIGLNQVVGDDFGFEIGVCYFRQYFTESKNDVNTINSIYNLQNYSALGFNVGFREYWGDFLFRLNFTPFYKIEDKEFKTSLGLSLGWGF